LPALRALALDGTGWNGAPGGSASAGDAGRAGWSRQRDAVRDGDFDEIIVSTLPRRTSKGLRRDLIDRIKGLGLPVTSIVPGDNVKRDATDYMFAASGPP
jgi:hypothetical protein